MSLNNSTGVRKRDNLDSKIEIIAKENEQNLIQSFKLFNAESPASGLVSSGNAIGAQPGGNGFVDTIIAGVNGGIGYLQEQIAISTEQINIFKDDLEGVFSSNVKLIADGANDILDFITGGDLPGQILKLVGDDTLDVTIKNADGASVTSNILFPGTTNDFTLKAREIIEFIFDPNISLNGNDGCWCFSLGDSTSGGGGITFPIDFPEEQRGTVGSSTEIIDFTQSDRHAVIMTLDGDIGLSLINTTAGKLQITSIKLKQDGTGGHAFTGFTQTVANEQVIIDAVNDNNAPNGFTEFIVEFTDGLFNAYLKTGNIVSGSGGLAEPVELGFNEVTTETPPTFTVIAGDIFNPSHIDLNQDITLQLDISATATKYKSIFIIFDTTGNSFTVTWPASVTNPPIIDDSIAQRISVILYTIDNGVTWTHATSVGSGVGNFLPLAGGTMSGNIDMGNNNTTSIDTLDFFQAGQSIQNKADADGGILYNVNDLQAHIFRAGTDEIARFSEVSANVFRLEMLDHSIRDAQDVTLDNTSGAIVFAGTSPAIGYDSTASRFIINHPTGANIFVTENNAIGSTQINTDSLSSNIVNANDVLQLGVDVTVPTATGEFRSNGTDVFVFSGAAVRNFSNIGAGSPLTTKGDIFTFDTNNARLPVGTNGQVLTANSAVALGVEWATGAGGGATVELDNLGTTSINANLTPQGGLLLGSDAVPWSRVIGNKFSLGTAGTFAASDNAIIADATLGMEYNTPSADFHSFYFANVKRLEIGTSTLKFVSGGTIQAQIFQLSGNSAVDPITLGQFNINGSDVSLFAPNFKLTNTTVGGVGTATFVSYRNYAAGTNDELGSIRFDGGVSPTQYARILAGVGEATDSGLLALEVRADNSGLQTAILLKGDDDNTNTYMTVNSRINSDLKFGNENAATGAFNISPVLGSTTLQIVVQDNAAFTDGDEGMLACPVLASLTPSLTNLDNAFGDHVGAMGVFNTSSAQVNIAWKSRSDEWVVIAIPSGSGTVIGEHFN